MSEYEVTRTVRSSSSDAFAVAADLDRLPEWLAGVEVARRTPTGEVHLQGRNDGSAYARDGLWRARPEQLRVEWSSESHGSPEAYSGWLQVADRGVEGEASSEVTVHLSFYSGDGPSDVDARLGAALEALAGLVTG